MDWISGVPDLALNYIIEIVMALAIAFLLPRVYDWLKLKADDQRRVVIEDSLRNGLLWALQQARLHSTKTDRPSAFAVLRDPDERRTVVDAAKDYVLSGTAESLKKLGVDERTLVQRLEARLPKAAEESDKSHTI